MIRWAQSKCNRNQVVLFAPTLDDSVAADHPVRLFEEVLKGLDFREWEAAYERVDGQPPIHPRVVAGAILYGMSLGIRSSRRVEDATANRVDFIWLCSGRVIDHATVANFRVKFGSQIKALFRQVGKVAIGMGLANLNQIVLDGTVKRSNNSRYRTARRASLEEKIAILDQQVDQMIAEWKQQDANDQELFGERSATKLPRELKDLSQRQARLKEALKKMAELEAKQAGRKDVSKKGPAVPTTDPDSSVIKNKTGGYAPNYTVVLATEGQNGFIVDAQVQGGSDEPSSVMPAVRQIEASFGQKPGELLADSNFNTGPNLKELSDQETEPLMPPRQPPAKENPALRADPTQPVADEQHQKLPINPQLKVLDKSAFIYDPQQDHYHCPMGQKLGFAGTTPYHRDSIKGTYRIYEAAAGQCAGCPLAGKCLPGKSRQRRVLRDEYEPLREQMAVRMQSDSGKARYKRRSFLAETPFAVMNTTMNFHQFLLRGIEKAGVELFWTCGAMNLSKLVRLICGQRAQQTSLNA
jgi:transposase